MFDITVLNQLWLTMFVFQIETNVPSHNPVDQTHSNQLDSTLDIGEPIVINHMGFQILLPTSSVIVIRSQVKGWWFILSVLVPFINICFPPEIVTLSYSPFLVVKIDGSAGSGWCQVFCSLSSNLSPYQGECPQFLFWFIALINWG